MTLPAFRAAGTFISTGSDATPGIPAGTALNDILLLVLETEAAGTPPAAPSGYAEVTNSPQVANTGTVITSTRLAVFWKRAGASESAPTVTDVGNHIMARLFAFSGCIETGDPWDVTAGDADTTSTTTVTIPGATTTTADCLVVLVAASGADVTSTTEISGWANADLANIAERSDDWSAGASGGGFGVATGEKASAGAYTTSTATLVNAHAQGRMSIALKPPAGGGAQSISVGAASETETAKSVTATPGAVTVTVAAASETETAKTTAAVSTISVTVGAASETETANTVAPVAGAVTITVGAASETETAKVVTATAGTVTISVGVASETETAKVVAVVAGVDLPAGLILWLKADAITGLNDGDRIDLWEDASPAGDDFVTSTLLDAVGPVYETGELNSLPVARFTEGWPNNAGMEGVTPLVVTHPYTIFYVGKYNDVDAQNRRIITSDSVNWLMGPHDGFWQWYSGDFADPGPDATDGAWVIHAVRADTASGTHFVWDLITETAPFSAARATPDALGTLLLGYSGNSIPAESDVAEVVVFDTELSDTDRDLVVAYLREKWAGIVPAQSISVAVATETETARAVTATPGVVTIAVTKASEVETAVAVAATATITITVGVATETETANPVAVDAGAAPQTISVAVATETETAQAVTVQTTVTIAVGAASETETAQAVTVTVGAVTVTVGTATETETANVVQPVSQGGPQSISVAVATELETAQAVTVATTITVTVGAAAETETAQGILAVPGAVLVAVGVATETETAGAVTVQTVTRPVPFTVSIVDRSPGVTVTDRSRTVEVS